MLRMNAGMTLWGCVILVVANGSASRRLAPEGRHAGSGAGRAFAAPPHFSWVPDRRFAPSGMTIGWVGVAGAPDLELKDNRAAGEPCPRRAHQEALAARQWLLLR